MLLRRVTAVLAIAFLLLAGASPALAEPVLRLPLDCRVNETCWIQNYVDADPAKGAVRDFQCGTRSYDDHNGTDFRIAARGDGKAPVTVLAAADGRVVGTRDGVLDRSVAAEGGRAAVIGIECGNGVVVDHGGGWTTQYCHMAQGSIRVKQGQMVKTGAALGSVGLSGLTEYPHLHFTVRRDGRIADPFAIDAAPSSCGGGHSIWAKDVATALAYRTRVVQSAGFGSRPVSNPGLDTGADPGSPPGPDAPALIAHVRALGLKPGDVPVLTINGPDGATVAEFRGDAVQRPQAQNLVYTGRRRPEGGFKPGVYVGRYRVENAGATVLEQEFRIGL